jgi:hypothetical protein
MATTEKPIKEIRIILIYNASGNSKPVAILKEIYY